ncbi:MAG TPA: hypothetical protein VN366_13450 [Feifaniaceae bacterium]|nr:hypothetical protein [Feifaniaceae bacterium]
MVGFLIGAVCGVFELYLLSRLTLAVQNGRTAYILPLVLVKLLVLAAAFVPVILYFRDDLLWCGVGISASLIIGTVILNVVTQRSGKGDKKS